MSREPLPPHLAQRPFSVLESGLNRKRLDAKDLDRTVYGMRVATTAPMDLKHRCAVFAARLRNDAFFSHTTSAMLWGAPVDFRYEKDARLHVTVLVPESPPHARGIIGHHVTAEPANVVSRDGLRVASPALTWCQLASILNLEDLVAVGDYFLFWQLPLTTRSALATLLDGMAGQRGVRLARMALPLLSDRSESRPESRLRAILALGGMDDPQINHVLVNSETGKRVRPDFLFAREKLILEYQGDYHRTKDQWRKDMTRRELLQAKGWYVMELNAADLYDSDALIRRIRSVLASRRNRLDVP